MSNALFNVEKPKQKNERRDLFELKDELLSIDCWENYLYNNAYQTVVKDLYPIVIPSYNRPMGNIFKYISTYMENDYIYPVFVVIRNSQKELYEASPYIKDHKYITLLDFPDEEIDDIGKVRAKIVDYFSNKYTNIFMLDDDLFNFVHTVPYTTATGKPKSQKVLYTSFGKVMSMWQLAHACAIAKFNNIIMSCPLLLNFSWTPECALKERSMYLFNGSQTMAICLNLKLLKEHQLNYLENRIYGHEDVNLLIRCLQKGLIPVEFKWISYDSTGPGTNSYILPELTAKERYNKHYADLWKQFSEVPFVFTETKKGVSNLRINWQKCKQYFSNSGFGVWPKLSYYNIYDDCLQEIRRNIL